MGIYHWQADAWKSIQSSKGRLHHAWLLHGPSGTGKLAFARTFAQAMLCEDPTGNGLPCGTCPACAWFAQGSHPDFRALEPEALTQSASGEASEPKGEKKGSTHIAIAQVRELADFVNLSSHRNGPRVILIHPAEAMNPPAANALLKTLEEPPPETLIILVSHQPSHLLPTIRSRCRKLEMPMPDREAALAWLEAQGTANAALCLAQAGGAPLTARAVGQADHQALRRNFIEVLIELKSITPFNIADKYSGHDLSVLINWLQQWIYDLIGLKLAGGIRYHPDFAQALRGMAEKISTARLLAFQRELQEARRAQHHPLNGQLVLEGLLISYADLTRPEEVESIHD